MAIVAPVLGFMPNSHTHSFFPVSQGYSCVGVDCHDDYSADSSTSLAQCSFVGGFLLNFAIFALVSDLLGNFCLSSCASLWQVQCFSLPTQPAYSPLSLSPLVSSLGGQSCSPPSLVASVLFALGALLL